MKTEIEDTDDPRVVLTREQADQLIEPGEYVHTFMQAVSGAGLGMILVGADRTRAGILRYADEGKCELAGPAATAMHHAVVVFTDRGPVFVETVRTPVESTL